MKNIIKSNLLILAIVGGSALANPAFAVEEFNVAPGLTYAGAPLGLHGADPVSLVNEGVQVEGDAQYLAAYEGVAYYFADAENQAIFEANPEQFLPQNGGFCTLGVAYSMKLDGNPDYAAVVDGKLFVFVNQDALDAFNKDQENLIGQADIAWPVIRSIAALELQ